VERTLSRRRLALYACIGRASIPTRNHRPVAEGFLMRIAAPASLLALLLAGFSVSSRAELRYVSSRLFDSHGNDAMYSGTYLAPSRLLAANAAGLYLVARADSAISFGGPLVGPGVVGARFDATAASAVWSRALTGLTTTATITALAPEDDGSVILGGYFRGTMDFGGGSMTATLQTGDAFVLKLDATGTVVWQHRYGTNYDQSAYGVIVAANGDILVIGSNNGTINLGGGSILSNGSTDVFVARLDNQTGAHIWSRGFGQTGQQEGLAIANASDGHIALMCYLGSGGIDFGGGLLRPFGGHVALAMLDADGNHVWSRVVGGAQGGFPNDVAVDSAGNTVICGRFVRTFDPGNGTLLISNPYSTSSGFLASYGPGGDYRWSYALLDSLYAQMIAVGTSASGDCIVTATAKGKLQEAGLSVSPAAFLILDFDSLGNVDDVRGFGEPTSYTTSFLSMRGDDIFVAGSTNARIDFGGDRLYPAVGTDLYLAHLAIRRPALATIDNFTARLSDAGVELSWTLSSGESLDGYYLTRRSGATGASVIYSAPAVDGDAGFVDQTAQPGRRYTYELTVETSLGDPVSSATSIDVPAVTTRLDQNSPNPFNPLTTFTYTLASEARVSVAIYDLSGALIARLDQGIQPAGKHEARWAGHNWEGNVVSSGVYFYRLEGAGDIPARKMILLK
jgi:hypothetical protein